MTNLTIHTILLSITLLCTYSTGTFAQQTLHVVTLTEEKTFTDSITTGIDFALASNPYPETKPAIGKDWDSENCTIAWNAGGDHWNIAMFQLPNNVITSHSLQPPSYLPYEFPEKFGQPWDLDWKEKLEEREEEGKISSFLGHIGFTYSLAEVYNYLMVDTRPMVTMGHIFYFFVSSSGNWSQVYTAGTPYTAPYETMSFTKQDYVGYLPHRKEFILGTKAAHWSYDFGTNRSYRTFHTVNPFGKGSWSYKPEWIKETSIWLPLDSAEFIVVQSTLALRLKGTDTLAFFTLPPSGSPHRIILLDSNTFLRSYTDLDSTSTFVAETWTADGNLLGSITIPNAPQPLRSGNYSTAFRAFDHTLAIFWGSNDSGIHTRLFDSQMLPLTSTIQLSQWSGKTINPSGLFKQDTLVVIWEDYRNGNADIYGNTLSVPLRESFVGDVDEEKNEGNGEENKSEEETIRPLIKGVWPNPTENGIHISFGSRSIEPTTIELFDLLGQRIVEEHVSAGLSGAWIDLRGTKPGYYVVRWSSAMRSGTESVLVVR